MSDIITQSDLNLLMSVASLQTQVALSLRRRLRSGATVEPGPLALKEDDPTESIEELEAEPLPSGVGLFGVSVYRAENTVAK